jgi:phage tail tape-measure protein
MRNSKFQIIAAALAALPFVWGCSGQPLTTREKGTGVGAVLGAGTGAIIGAAVGHPAAGAAIGGGLGAAGGFAVGNHLQNQEYENARTRHALSSQQRELNSQRVEIRRLQQSNETE